MSRMWEIREGDSKSRYENKNKYSEDYSEDYECGFEDGYRKAMREFRSRY